MAIGPLNITKSTNGGSIILTCSAEFVPYSPPVVNVNFEWSFDLTNSTTLPSDVTKSNTTKKGSTYSSTLQFSSLLSTQAEIYTCHFAYVIGGNQKRLSANITVSVSRGEIPTTLIQSPTTSISDVAIYPTISTDIETQSLATSASDVIGNHSDPNSSVAVAVTTVVFILIIIIAAGIVITAIVYR